MQGSGSGGVVIDLAETNIWIHPTSSGGMLESFPARRFSAAIAVDESGHTRFGADSAGEREPCVLGVLSRLGDPVPVLVGDRLVPAAGLVAGQIDAALESLEGDLGNNSVTIIHPDHVRAADIAEVVVHLDHDGPMRWVSRGRLVAESLGGGGTVGVVHIGSTTAEVSLWTDTPARPLAPAVTRRGAAGRLVDEIIARTVSASANGGAVNSDPAEAKHRLSHETAVDLFVGDGSVRLVRDELRAMVDQVAGPVIEALEVGLRRAGASREDLQRVVLIGGSASLPGLVEQISAWCDAPVNVEPRVGNLVATLEGRDSPEGLQPFLVTATEPAATPSLDSAPELGPPSLHSGPRDRVRSAIARGRHKRGSEPRVRLSRRTGVAAMATLALVGVASVSGAAPVMTSARLVMEVIAAADDGGITADEGENVVTKVSRAALQALPLSEENRDKIVETIPPVFVAIAQEDQGSGDSSALDGPKPWQSPDAYEPAGTDERRTPIPYRTNGPRNDNSRKPTTSPAKATSTGKPSGTSSSSQGTGKPAKPSPSPSANSGTPPTTAPAPSPSTEPSNPPPSTTPPNPPPSTTPPNPPPTSDPPPSADPPETSPPADASDTGTP